MRSAAYLAKGVFLGLFAALAACGGGGGGDNAQAPVAETSAPVSSEEVPIAFERVMPGEKIRAGGYEWPNSTSPSAPPENEEMHSFVVRSDAQWVSAWRHFTEVYECPVDGPVIISSADPDRPMPETCSWTVDPDRPMVDFSRSMLVGVSVLADAGCNSKLEIIGVVESESRITVRYRFNPVFKEEEGLYCLPLLSPRVNVDFVKIKASSKPIDFVFDGIGSYQDGKLVVSDNPSLNPNGKIREIPFEPIQHVSGEEIFVPDRTTYVADTADKWQSIWNRQFQTLDQQGNIVSPMAPTVDFSTSRAVGVTYLAASGCYDISINRVVEDDKHIVVEFEETHIWMTCVQISSYRTLFVKIKPSSKPVQFRGVRPDVLIEGEGTWEGPTLESGA